MSKSKIDAVAVSQGARHGHGLVSEIDPIQVSIGHFVIRWSQDHAKRWVLTVLHMDDSHLPVWQSIPGQAFVHFSSGAADVSESRGFFKVKERAVGPRFDQQTIIRHETSQTSIRLFGENRTQDATGQRAVAWTIDIAAIDECQICFHVACDEPAVNRTELVYHMAPVARIFGFGIQFTHLNMQGRRIPILSQEPGIGRGIQPLTMVLNALAGAGGKWHTTNASVPYYLTSQRHSVCLENTEYSVFDFTQAGKAKVTVHSGTLKARAFYGPTPLDLIEAYTRYAGRMHPLPDWIHQGAVIGMQGGTDCVRTMHNRLRAFDAPVAAFWLQDWVGARRTSIGWQLWWNWEVDHQRYPGWQQTVEDFKADGIRVLTYLNPFLVDPTEKGEFTRNLFAEAREKGFLIRRENGEPYMILNTSFSAAMIDLAHPEARTWIKEVIKTELLGSGASGWMADFAEALPFDAKLYGDTDAAAYHNAYPVEWAKVNREAIEEAGRLGDVVFFTRSGFTRSPGYSTLFWMGDQLTSWRREDGIKSTIVALLASGMSGYSFNHSDIGGYIATTAPRVPIKIPGFSFTRSKELMMRWIELNAFTVVYRTHEGNQPARHWQIDGDDETTAHFARFARVYAALAEYRKTLCEDAAQKGFPVVRHPWLQFPDDPRCLELEMQFMLGSEIMVAPVLDAAMDAVCVYLPSGDWVHLWTGAVSNHGHSTGGRYRVPAPIGAPAIFYRKGWEHGASVRSNLATSGDLNTGLEPERIFSQSQ